MEEKRDVSKAESFTRQPYNSICVPAQSDVDVLTENVNKGDGLKGLTSAENTGSIMFSIKDQIGHLADAIKVFQENEVKVIHIESRRSRRRQSEFDIFVDVRVTSLTLDQLVCKLRSQVPGFRANDVTVTCMTPTDKHGCKENLSWFPRAISDLDHFANRVLMYGSELDADHPGFKDNTYRQRRTYFANIAKEYQYGKPIPRIEYTEEEVKTWGTVYRELTKLYPTHACCEYLDNLPLLIEHCGFREDNLPQLEDVSQFLQARTGFRLRPVAGYLSSRDFLAGLAFRMFHCTQYIRHSSDPFYTPEPDCCHELLGHMPLLADPSFAEFSQEIGLASLGASDAEVQKLATCYFFTIEFGLCKQDGSLRAYGAGLLSSIGELKHALSDKAEKMAFEPAQTCRQECLITTFQDVYFFTESFEEAKERMRQFASTIRRPFSVKYNPYTQNVEILNNIPSIASMVNVVKGELAVISDALNKLQTPSKEPKSSQPNGSTMKDPLIH